MTRLIPAAIIARAEAFVAARRGWSHGARMAVQAFTLGPGQLVAGAPGSAQNVQAQLSNCRIEWSENVSGGDDLNLLDGGQLTGEQSATYRAALAGTFVQDISPAGFLAWTWAHMGEEQPFTFIPNDEEGQQVAGVFVPVPLTLGGPVKAKNTSDFTFRCIGHPALGAVPVEP